MHIESLKIFVDLSTSGSFSQAGRDNKISQSAVSQQIMCLEKKIGRTLLVRGGRSGVELTSEGKIFLEGCKAILARFDETLVAIHNEQDNVVGSIKLVTESSICRFWLKKQLEQFLQHYPEAEVHIEHTHRDGVYASVTSREADLGLVPRPTPRPKLHIELLQAENLMLLASASSPKQYRDEYALSDLEGERFVAFASNAEMRDEIQRQFRMQGVDFKPTVEFDQIDAAKRAVLEGGGITLLPAAAATEALSSGLFIDIPLTTPLSPLFLGVVSRRDSQRTPLFQALVEALQQPKN
jgi:DNA-binding transcriptional LysR family regulator